MSVSERDKDFWLAIRAALMALVAAIEKYAGIGKHGIK